MLAILVRVAVPQGWMPVASADGVRFTLCSVSQTITAQDAARALLDSATNKADTHDSDAGTDCPYAVSAAAVALPAPAPAAPGPLPVGAAPAPAREAGLAPGRGLAAPPPPATGPPSLA